MLIAFCAGLQKRVPPWSPPQCSQADGPPAAMARTKFGATPLFVEDSLILSKRPL